MDANVKRTLKSVIATLSALTALGLLCVGIYFLPSAEAARQTSAFQGPISLSTEHQFSMVFHYCHHLKLMN